MEELPFCRPTSLLYGGTYECATGRHSEEGVWVHLHHKVLPEVWNDQVPDFYCRRCYAFINPKRDVTGAEGGLITYTNTITNNSLRTTYKFLINRYITN
jgi:hypothetical protein